MIIVRDIETRSVIDLGDVGIHRYAVHPKTQVLCVGYCIDKGTTKIWHPGEPIPKPFFDKKAKWVAHNAAFEMAIERCILAPRYGYPLAPIEQQVCTMAQSLALALPGSLEKIGSALNLKNQKDTAGARLMMKVSKPRRALKGENPNGIYFHDAPELMAALDQYCMRDVAATREIYFGWPSLSKEEQLVWLLDQRINNCGFFLDRQLADAADKIAGAMTPRVNGELTKITNGVITAATQVKRLTAWVKQHADIKKLGKDVIADLLEKDIPNHVRRVLELRLLGSQAAVAKVGALLDRRCADGRVRGAFVYHAAGPGRWSSRGAQVHNLKRPLTEDLEHAIKIIGTGDVDLACQEYENPLSVIGDCIRAMIIAPPGHTLIGGDFSGIEARVTAWLGKDEAFLDVFRAFDEGRGPDPYIVTAAEIFNLNPEQLAADYKAGKPEAREIRQVGKAAVLAFGYQGGVRAYRKFAPGTTLSDAEIDEIKDKWRAAHKPIVSLWHHLNRAIELAIVRKEEQTVKTRITIVHDDQKFLRIMLPNGRRLSYPEARYARSWQIPNSKFVREGWHPTFTVTEGVIFKDNASGAWDDVRMYGGMATENIVQAIARDLLAEAMLRVDKAGLKIVTHIHDEIVIESPLKHAERDKKKFAALMKQTSPWADGLPIAVNTWVNTRYTK